MLHVVIHVIIIIIIGWMDWQEMVVVCVCGGVCVCFGKSVNTTSKIQCKHAN